MKQQPVTENSLNFLLAIIWLKRIWLHIYTYKHPFQRLGQNPSKCKRSSGVPSLDGTPELLYFTFPCDLYLFSNPVDLHCRRLLSAGTASASSEKPLPSGSSDSCCFSRSQPPFVSVIYL